MLLVLLDRALLRRSIVVWVGHLELNGGRPYLGLYLASFIIENEVRYTSISPSRQGSSSPCMYEKMKR